MVDRHQITELPELNALLMLPDAVYVVDRDGLRILFCNDRFAELLGDCRERIQGKPLFELLSPADAAPIAQQLHQVFTTGAPLLVEEQLALSSGVVHLETHRILLKQENCEAQALVSTSRDITEAVQARAALAACTQQLAAANRELDALAYGISHDLKSPLRHINGFVNILQQRLTANGELNTAIGEVEAKTSISHYLQILHERSQHMAQQIDGLLLLSRIGRQPMQIRSVSLELLVQQAIALLPLDAGDRPVEFTVGPLPTVAADAILMQQALHNLLENAVKFSRNSPAPQVAIGSLPDRTIFVRDNGVGFAMRYADQLFGAFQRLHAESEFEGIGLGLAIAQRIIHRHGGKIWAESEPNQGACFYVRI